MADVFTATFPGIADIRRVSFTLSHGTTPGVAMIEMTPQPDLATELGPLVLTYNGGQILFPDMRVNRFSFRRDRDGLIWALCLYDRRWRWAYGEISGTYNWRFEDGTIDGDHDHSPQDLAKLLLDAMGERGYDLSQLPDDLRPFVEWDRDNPAVELAKLCEENGCHVVLRLNNTVKICRMGFGANLPDLPSLMDEQSSLQSAMRPDKIKLVFAPTKIELIFGLEAVAPDIDGSWKKIDSLSYKPAAGWGGNATLPGQSLGNFDGVPDTPIRPIPAWLDPNTGITRRQLAKQYVFRNYRISSLLAPGIADRLEDKLGFAISGAVGAGGTPFYFDDAGRDQFLLLDKLLSVDPQTQEPYDPIVLGIHRLRNGLWQNSANWTFYRRPFHVDRERQQVVFSDYVIRWLQAAQPNAGVQEKYGEAYLWLIAACEVRDAETWLLARETREIRVPGPAYGTGPKIIEERELGSIWKLGYNAPGGGNAIIASSTRNDADLDKEANFRLAAALREFALRTPADNTYAGWIPIDPDGAIEQVSWEGEQGVGATTRASRGMEFSLVVPPYRERQTAQWLQDLREALEA